MQSELRPGLPGLVLGDAGESAVVLDRGCGQEELALLGGCGARVDVVVVAHVDVVDECGTVVDWSVPVLPGDLGLGNSLQ